MFVQEEFENVCVCVFVVTFCIIFLFGTDVYVESFLKDWKTDYKRLERVHSYIQWYVKI